MDSRDPSFRARLGAAYAVAARAIEADVTSTAVAGDVIRDRWLSLFGAYFVLLALWIGAFLASFMVGLILVGIGLLIANVVDVAAVGGVFVIFGIFLSVIVYFLCAMAAQFL